VTAPDWRTRKKAATREAIRRHALRLFLRDGYEATTVEEIAAAAGVSHMTFFRYFPRKEAVVESDDYDPLLADLVAARPAGEDPFTAIHQAVRAGLAAVLPDDRDAILVRTRLTLETPALRARNYRNQDDTRELFAVALARREGRIAPDLRIRVVAAAALAALTTAITAWAEGDGAADLVSLVDEAFAALRHARPSDHGADPG
jgi:AcrR family transcriptional regulator